jgi:nucleoid-associated protein YgaU
VPHQSRNWVIDSLTWGDAEMNLRGNRTRQQVTVSLLEYIGDVRADQNSPSQLQRLKATSTKTAQGAARKRVVASRARGTTFRGSAPGTVTVGFGEGDDLLSIAAKELGAASRWMEIGKLNGIRDPRNVKPGQVIRLP